MFPYPLTFAHIEAAYRRIGSGAEVLLESRKGRESMVVFLFLPLGPEEHESSETLRSVVPNQRLWLLRPILSFSSSWNAKLLNAG